MKPGNALLPKLSVQDRTGHAWLRVLFAFVLIVTLSVTAASSLQAQSDDDQQYTYIVSNGDSWSIIAEATGVSVGELQRLNRKAVRANGWLLVGEEIIIPLPAPEEAGEEANETPSTTDEPSADTPDEEEAAAEETDGGAAGEEVYVVGAGESWISIANQLDISVDELKAANPEAVRADDVLYRGISLIIPRPAEETEEIAAGEEEPADDSTSEAAEDDAEDGADEAEAAEEEAPAEEADQADDAQAQEDEAVAPDDGAEPADESIDEMAEPTDAAEGEAEPYTVGPGESWNSIARVLDIDPETLRAANPDLIRPDDVLHVGDELNVPDAAALAAAASATEGMPDCPATFADYPEALTTVLNSEDDGPEALSAFLGQCGARAADDIVVQDWTADGIDDLVAVFIDPATAGLNQIADLMVFNGTDDGYEAAFRARAAGSVDLLATEDVNADGQADIIWTDTTCGDSTCFDTVNVRSWDGTSWRDWTDGTITMAYGNVDLEEAYEAGQGNEIVVSGGVYGSVGAGPQRSRSETWGSIEGQSYTMLEQIYNASECLYHTVMDGNRALLNAEDEGFGAAEAFFTDAISNEALIKCWVRDDELDELRGFSYFRLAQIAAYQELPDVAGDLVTALNELYPEGIYTGLANAWADAYATSGNVADACAAATAYAEENPDTWQALADYGYTNPAFAADDVCAAIDYGQEEIVEEAPDMAAEEAAASATEAATEAAEAATEAAEAVDETAETTEPDANEEAADDETTGAADMEDAGDAEMAATDTVEATEAADAGETLPECPPNVDRFARVLPDAIAAVDGDLAAVDAWLATCDAVVEGEQVSTVVDLNADGIDDVVYFPTIVSDLGFGPGGSQGALLVYHGQEDGSYELAHSPEIYGLPSLLAAEDVNEDGNVELVWTVTSCATFCVVEVQMVAWDGEGYVSAIEPGATIAEGRAYFEPLGSGAAGAGQALILEGGVSGLPDGGLSTPHSEVWQSVDGTPYQRLEWVYDRNEPGNDCLGLRLIEADIALQAADALGYGDAIDLYAQTLDPELQGCSLFGMPATSELVLLQGLASFRLMQAQALNGDADAAQATLLALQSGQPDGEYTRAATEWLASYIASGDAETACSAVSWIFEENEDLWQITDHYGYNHPALPAQQICFVP